MTLKTAYRGESTNQLSQTMWWDCPMAEIAADPSKGYGFFDDFLSGPDVTGDAAISVNSQGNFHVYGDIGVDMRVIGEAGGVMEISGNDADNDEGHISTGGAYVISDTAADAKKLWFECRMKKASIADNALSFFAGLGFDFGNDVSLAKANGLVDNTGVLGSFAGIGFSCVAAAGETVNFVYNQDADATITSAIAAVHTLVADTYVKLGFKYDPSAVAAKKIAVFVDGVEQTTYVTATNIAAATFPDAEELGACLLTKVGAAAESKAQIDWMAAYQLR